MNYTQAFLNEVFGPFTVTPKDSFSIHYVGGFMFCYLSTASGMHVELVRHYDVKVDAFKDALIVNPKLLEKDERNRIIIELDEGGIPQERIARFFELSQSAISMIVRAATKARE